MSLAHGPGGVDVSTASTTRASASFIAFQPGEAAVYSTSFIASSIAAIATRSTFGNALSTPSRKSLAEGSFSPSRDAAERSRRTPRGANGGGARSSIALSTAATHAPNASFILCAPPLSFAAAWQFSASRPQIPSAILSHISSVASTVALSSPFPEASTQSTPPRERRYAIWKPSSHDTRLRAPVPAASAYAAIDASSATVGNDGAATPP